ncbi:MAG TPA: ROK family protein [Candidatus Paceibacterota bacterium]|nr:ROK family protein [Candidatus Paceibacterota bacterium]
MAKIVFDIGGTNMRVARWQDGAVADAHKEPTPRGREAGLSKLLELARAIAGEEPIEAVAGGFAGVIGPRGTILHSPHLPGWEGCSIADAFVPLAERVSVTNDAAAGALGEAVFGAGSGSRVVAYVAIGTGVGGSRIVDGQVDSPAHGFEPGHQIVEVSTDSTLESRVSGSAMTARYAMHPSLLPREAYDGALPYLAAGLSNILMLWSPDMLVLGGSMMNEENGYRLADITAAVRELALPHIEVPPIAKAELGDQAGLYGGGVLLQR